MSTLDGVALVAVVLVALAWFLSYSAARLDRLHARLEATYAALDAQLVRRAEATLELANSGHLDPATAFMLAAAAADSLAHAEADEREREVVESHFSEALDVALTSEVLADLRGGDEMTMAGLDRVSAAGVRVQLARRFHNDAVTDVRRVRRKASVRIFRLAGHAAMPRTIDFDDALPVALRG